MLMCVCIVNAQEYCYEMRVIQAFSWMQFALFTFAIVILLALVSQAEKFGRHRIWEEPIRGPCLSLAHTPFN